MHQILIFGKTSAVFDHLSSLTHWGLVTHICVSKQTIIGADNGLSPGRRQAIIWTIAGIMLIGLLETNFSEILIEIYTFSFKKMHLKMSNGEWWPSCLGINVLNAMQYNVIKFSNEGGPTLITGALFMMGYPPKPHPKSRSSITSALVVLSFWNSAKCMVVSLSRSVQNLKTFGLRSDTLWENAIIRYLRLWCVSDGYPTWHKTPGWLRWGTDKIFL